MNGKSIDTGDDPRLAEMLDVIFSYARGDLKARGTLSDDDSVVDGLMAGINILGEELEVYRAETRQATDSLRQALDYTQTLIRSSPDGILAVDRDLRINECNLVMEQMCGKARELVVGRALAEIPFMQETGEAERIRVGMNTGEGCHPREIAYQFPGANKQSFFESVEAPLRGQSGELQGAVVRIRDITEHKQAEEQLRLASLYARSLIEAGMDPLVTINAEGKIMDVNEAAVQATGVLREWLVGSEFPNFFTEPDKAHAAFREAYAKGGVRNYPLTIRHISGKRIDVLYNANVYHNGNGEIAGVMAVARDISDRRRAERAEDMARRDSLTGLYNHRAFYDLLKAETVRTRRFNRPVSMFMLDIDHFKTVNDTNGHQAGDAILRGLSDFLSEQARSVDNVCRYGGEEFAVILPETDAVSAMQIAERLRANVQKKHFDIGSGKTIDITVSIGVATYPAQADTLDEIIKAADVALYAAKQAGRNRVSQSESKLPKHNLLAG